MFLTGLTPRYSNEAASSIACLNASLYDRYSNGPACKGVMEPAYFKGSILQKLKATQSFPEHCESLEVDLLLL